MVPAEKKPIHYPFSLTSAMVLSGMINWMKKRKFIVAGIIFQIFLVLNGPVTLSAGPFHGQVGIAIERSFGTGNPEHLKPYLQKDSKIFLSLPTMGISPGNYSKQQTILTLRQLFERFITRGFSLEGGHLPNFTSEPIKAVWKYSPAGSQEKLETTLYFTITSNPLAPIIKSIRGN